MKSLFQILKKWLLKSRTSEKEILLHSDGATKYKIRACIPAVEEDLEVICCPGMRINKDSRDTPAADACRQPKVL